MTGKTKTTCPRGFEPRRLEPKWLRSRRARLRALVADIRSNIISTTTLCAAGWKFLQDKDRFDVLDAQSGERAADVAYFAGCPLIRLQPDWGMQSRVDASVSKCMSHVEEQSQQVSSFPCNRLTRASEEALYRSIACRVTCRTTHVAPHALGVNRFSTS